MVPFPYVADSAVCSICYTLQIYSSLVRVCRYDCIPTCLPWIPRFVTLPFRCLTFDCIPFVRSAVVGIFVLFGTYVAVVYLPFGCYWRFLGVLGVVDSELVDSLLVSWFFLGSGLVPLVLG